MKLLVYSPQLTARLEYIFRLVLEEILGIRVDFTQDTGEFSSHPGPALAYGPTPPSSPAIPFWKAHSLLFEDKIQPIEPDTSSNTILFPINDSMSVEQHDPFAAAFYMVSRYEEYLPFLPDKFGRFEAESSILYKKNVLDEPLVNQYSIEILKILLRFFPDMNYKLQQFRAVQTIDIDQSFSYKHKGFLWNGWIFLKNIFQWKRARLVEQLKVLIGKQVDPYDSFDKLRKLAREENSEMIFFIHAGDRGPHDKVIPVLYDGIPELIRSLGEVARVGIHPSFRSNEKTELLSREIARLRNILGKEITVSRQHYLKLKFPETYRNLIREGIKEDYTMGYASRPGFRAGICTPFRWFDLASNKVTDLTVHPNTWMEGNFIDYLKIKPEEAWEIIVSLERKVRQVHGQLITVWHNHTITDYGEWKGWKKIFELMRDQMKKRNGE